MQPNCLYYFSTTVKGTVMMDFVRLLSVQIFNQFEVLGDARCVILWAAYL